jgi:hypothetical protein
MRQLTALAALAVAACAPQPDTWRLVYEIDGAPHIVARGMSLEQCMARPLHASAPVVYCERED